MFTFVERFVNTIYKLIPHDWHAAVKYTEHHDKHHFTPVYCGITHSKRDAEESFLYITLREKKMNHTKWAA